MRRGRRKVYGSGIPRRIRRLHARGPRVDLRTPHARLGLDHDGAPGFVGMVPSPWTKPRSSLTRLDRFFLKNDRFFLTRTTFF
jgi:hypothetical protein